MPLATNIETLAELDPSAESAQQFEPTQSTVTSLKMMEVHVGKHVIHGIARQRQIFRFTLSAVQIRIVCFPFADPVIVHRRGAKSAKV